MSGERYDADWVRRNFDEFGEREARRFEESAAQRISLAVHRRLLAALVPRGATVLELGAGPGTFTELLVKDLGCRVTLVDISPVQVELGRAAASERGFAHGVDAFIACDVLEMDSHPDERLARGRYDVVLSYGGLLSYLFERVPDAIKAMRARVAPGGLLLGSVMSRWGTLRKDLGVVLAHLSWKVIDSGDLHPDTFPDTRHRCHLFRASELRDALEHNGCADVALWASNPLSQDNDGTEKYCADETAFADFVELELRAAADMPDAGNHIIFSARSTESASSL